MVSYEKLRILMVKRKIEWKHIIAGANITQYTARKLKRDEYIELQTLERICNYLECTPNEILEFIEEKKDH